jgi:hypothetical protein
MVLLFLLRVLSLYLEDSLMDITLADAWLMTVLWEEDSKLAWLAGYQCLSLHARIQGAILSLVVFHFREILHWRISIGFLCIHRNLNINHLAMCLDGSFFLGLAMSDSDIHKEIITLDRMLAGLQLSEIILVDKLHYFCEEWIKRNIFLQIV